MSTNNNNTTITATTTKGCSRTVKVLGFGSTAPALVLETITKLCKETTTTTGFVTSTTTVQPIRSQSIQYELLNPPYCVFLLNNDTITTTTTTTTTGSATTTNDATTTKQTNSSVVVTVLLYCLPTSYSEYIMNRNEVAQVRLSLLDISTNCTNDNTSNTNTNTTTTVVAIYDKVLNTFIGGTIDTIVQAASALTGNDSSCQQQQQQLACAGLVSLGQLDIVSAAQLGPNRQQDTVIVVGSGGREHAIAISLAKSPLIKHIICCPGNGGTGSENNNNNSSSKICNYGSDQDNDTVIAITKQFNANMVVIGPEQPLVNGLVDRLAVECPSVLAFGPTQAAAQLESSKAFTKDFLYKYNIPTASYKNFTNVVDAINYVESLDIDNNTNNRQVVKASGLAGGKGVLLPITKEETINAVKSIMLDKAFGTAGDVCVIESFMTGPEASCLAFCDGKTAKLLPAAQDHKRALDNDTGLNTGGMGAYAPAPCVTPLLQKQIEHMCQQTVHYMAQIGTPYIGILYAGIMITPNTGPSVLEFNCRFGDPETQVLLPLLETDLYEVLIACCTGTLDTVDIRFKESTAAATVVCAAAGYPNEYPRGMTITGLHDASTVNGVKVYHAGTIINESDGSIRCSGGRVLAVTGVAPDLESAIKTAYCGVQKIDFVNNSTISSSLSSSSLLHKRNDIGKKALVKKLRIGVLGSTRGTALVPIIEACANGTIDAEIVAVISNKASAPILDKGRALGVTVVVQSISCTNKTRTEFDAECTSLLVSAGVDFVLLVGYMRILSKSFTDFWYGRCINVHPSLLPKHAGGMDLAVHQAVIDAKENVSGCTIHQVTEEVDGGPIVVQKHVHVDITDTAESLKAKVQPLEGPAFIEAIQLYCRGTVIGYADAGVSIDAGNQLVELIKPYCKATKRLGCDADLGGFGGLFDLAAAGYQSSDTILIGATDGVGTKLRIAQSMKQHETIGIDLVAMCVNDLIVAGGEPLFFLDYFATGHLNVQEAVSVVKGIAEGCRQSSCGLIGGETAEMPSMYSPGDYDLAGFAVGAVHRDRVLPSNNICAGDIILGLASSGVHSNGFSLIRKLIDKEHLHYDSPCPWDTNSPSIGDSLLTPTKIYVNECLPLLKNGLLKGLAHITGGGLLENLPRSFPKSLSAEITYHPPLPSVFKWMQIASNLDDHEMLRTFNCGIGMVLIVSEANVAKVKETIAAINDACPIYDLGKLVPGDEHEVKMTIQLE